MLRLLGDEKCVVFGRKSPRGAGDDVGIRLGFRSFAFERLGFLQIASEDFLHLFQCGSAHVGELFTEELSLQDIKMSGRGAGSLLQRFPEIVRLGGDLFDLSLSAGDSVLGVTRSLGIFSLRFFSLSNLLDVFAQLACLFGKCFSLLGEASCLGSPLTLLTTEGLLENDDTQRLGFCALAFEVGGDEFDQHGVTGLHLQRREGQQRLDLGFFPGFAGDFFFTPRGGVDGVGDLDIREADIITRKPAETNGLISEEIKLVDRFNDLDYGR